MKKDKRHFLTSCLPALAIKHFHLKEIVYFTKCFSLCFSLICLDTDHGTTARGKLHGKTAHGKLHGKTAHGKLRGTTAHGKLHGKTAHGKLHGKTARGKLHGTTAHGKLHGTTAHGKLHGTTAHGKLHGTTAHWKLHGTTAHGKFSRHNFPRNALRHICSWASFRVKLPSESFEVLYMYMSNIAATVIFRIFDTSLSLQIMFVNQLLQLGTARTAWSDSVIRSETSLFTESDRVGSIR